MSVFTIDISESSILAKDLVELLNQHEEIIITNKNEPIAKATSLLHQNVQSMSEPNHRRIGLTKEKAWMSPDFDEPLEDFAEYI